jgi:hypothetical protein
MSREMGKTVLELLTKSQTDLLPDQAHRLPEVMDGVIVGVIVACGEYDQPLVAFDADSAEAPVSAQSVVQVQRTDVGRRICLLFEQGNRLKPIIIGFLQDQAMATPLAATGLDKQGTPLEARVDGDQVVIEGKREIVLKCGEASITLTRAGKILLRGKYLLSRSSGVNRIKGGSVQIN